MSPNSGLFQLHELEIITDDGVHHPRFALAEKPKLTDWSVWIKSIYKQFVINNLATMIGNKNMGC